MEYIVLGVIILAVVAISQLLKIYELSRELRPNDAPVISESDSRLNGRLGLLFLVAFFSFCFYCLFKWKHLMLPEPASLHGKEIDSLMNVTLIIIAIPFFICNILLFYFLNKYYFRKDRKADFFAHSNKMEAVWTIVPAIVLGALIIYGLTVWNDITGKTDELADQNPVVIELYARQFDWTARYAGADGKLGDANFQMINSTNALGLLTSDGIKARLEELQVEIDTLQAKIDRQVAMEDKIFPKKSKPVAPHHGAEGHGEAAHGEHAPHPNPEAKPHGEGHAAGGHHEEVDPYAGYSSVVHKMVEEKEHLERMKTTIATFAKRNFISGSDDLLVKGEFHIPVNQPVSFQFRSQDVIHSAFMPHFRAQMNCVPGMKTNFTFTPTITTAEMRKKTGNDSFEYYLLCNKICGNAHYNMKMVIVVESEADYKAWLKEQKTFAQASAPAAETAAPADSTAKKDTVAAAKADTAKMVKPAQTK